MELPDMRKFLFAAAGFAALTAAVGVAAAQNQPQQERPRGVFAMDANSDGVLTRQEFDAARTAQFTRLDANSDGFLSREEMRAQRGERGPRGHRGQLARADANNDGNITREEFLARPTAMFDRLDANKDGVISADERPQPRQRAEGQRAERPEGHRGHRARVDADSDGRVSRAEWDAAGAAMFQRLDANNDGRITQEEAQAGRPQRPARN